MVVHYLHQQYEVMSFHKTTRSNSMVLKYSTPRTEAYYLSFYRQICKLWNYLELYKISSECSCSLTRYVRPRLWLWVFVSLNRLLCLFKSLLLICFVCLNLIIYLSYFENILFSLLFWEPACTPAGLIALLYKSSINQFHYTEATI
jgi:hypothetical protein